MSLILDALKKSEREQDGSPPLESEEPIVSGPVLSGDDRVQWLFASVAILALLVLILLAVVLWPRARDEASPVVSTSPPAPAIYSGVERQVAVAVPEPKIESARDPRPLAAAPEVESEVAVDPQVQALYQTQVAEEVEQVVEPQVKTMEPVRAPGLAERQHAATLWREMREEREAADQKLQQLVTSTQRAPASAAAVPEVAAAETHEQPADGLAGFADLPFLHDLSVPVQNTIPTLMYSTHDYAAGTVTINKRQRREGDTLADNLVLEKLLADGIVLRMNEHRFKLSALNSWVNY